MISLGIGAAIILGIASILMTAFTQSAILTDAAEAEIDEMRAMNFIQNVFAQAINVRYWGNKDLNGYSGAVGQIRVFDSDALWADPRSAYPVAVFWREGMNSTGTALAGKSSQLKRTGIYFQKPRPPIAGARSTWGVLYGAMGNGPGPLAAVRGDQIFEGFTRMQIRDIRTFSRLSNFPNPGDPVTSFEIELTFRRFLGSRSDAERSFCPESKAIACPENPQFKDIVRVARITLRNNIIDFSPSGPFGARLFDLIHFFPPQLPENLR
jgi:hypothetical protein